MLVVIRSSVCQSQMDRSIEGRVEKRISESIIDEIALIIRMDQSSFDHFGRLRTDSILSNTDIII